LDRIVEPPVKLSFAKDIWGKGVSGNPSLTSSSNRWWKVGDGCGSLSLGGLSTIRARLLLIGLGHRISSAIPNPRLRGGWIRGGVSKSNIRDSPDLHRRRLVNKPPSRQQQQPPPRREVTQGCGQATQN
jgi:hypothetical protein